MTARLLQTIIANINDHEDAFTLYGVCGFTEVLVAFNSWMQAKFVRIGVEINSFLFFSFLEAALCVNDSSISDWSTITYMWVQLYATGRIHQSTCILHLLCMYAAVRAWQTIHYH